MSKNGKLIVVIVITCIIVALVVVGINSKMRTKTEAADSYIEQRHISEILDADIYEKVDIKDMAREYDEINAIFKGLDENGKVIGYAAFLTVKGYGGPMNVNVATDDKGEKILEVRVGDNNESEEHGKQVEKEDFYEQFEDLDVPLVMSGTVEPSNGEGKLTDGIYKATAPQYKDGYKAEVEIAVKEGKIENVSWDEKNDDGDSKKTESLKGEYDMSEDGLKWHEQVELMENHMENIQSPSKIKLNSDGTTDAVSSVTIRVDGFLRLVDDCIMQSMGTKETGHNNTIDSVSGATVSSTAVLNAANLAAEFIANNLNQ